VTNYVCVCEQNAKRCANILYYNNVLTFLAYVKSIFKLDNAILATKDNYDMYYSYYATSTD